MKRMKEAEPTAPPPFLLPLPPGLHLLFHDTSKFTLGRYLFLSIHDMIQASFIHTYPTYLPVPSYKKAYQNIYKSKKKPP